MFHEFRPRLSVSWPAKRRPRSSSSSRPDASPDSGNRIRCYTSSTISEGLQNPSTPLRERESLVPPRWTVRRIPLGSQSCENPERRKRPGRGFLRREGRERENKLRSLSTFRLRRSPSLITGLCGDTDAYGQLVSPPDSLLGKSVPVSRTILFTIRGIFKEDERERERIDGRRRRKKRGGFSSRRPSGVKAALRGMTFRKGSIRRGARLMGNGEDRREAQFRRRAW